MKKTGGLSLLPLITSLVLVTVASSGFCRLAANAVARSGHTVYPAMPETS